MIVDRVLRAHPLEVLSVRPSDKLIEVSRMFEQKRVGVAMVCDDKFHLIGVLSLGDVVHAIGERGAEVLNLPVRMVMTTELATCEPSDEIESALKKMQEGRIRHIPVVEPDGRLRGLIDRPSALEVLYDEANLDFTQLRNYVFKTGGRY